MTFRFVAGVITLFTLTFVLALAGIVLAATPRRGVNALAALLVVDAVGSMGGLLGLHPVLPLFLGLIRGALREA